MREGLGSINQSEIDAARRALSLVDPALAKANAVTPLFSWWTKGSGFAGLVALIVEQQVSVASAKAIFRRLEEGLGVIDADAVLARDIDQLKAYGLSTPKAKYILGVARAHAGGEIDLDELVHLDDDAACEKLIELKGIGRWTAEAYLMGCEGRTDVFPAGDIALQEAIRILDGAPARPSIKALYERAENWRPHRSIAAQLLWGYYGAIKQNAIPMPQGVPPMVKLAAAKTKLQRRAKPVTGLKTEPPVRRAASK